jgi:hypothetical protein
VHGGIDLRRIASGKATIGDLQRALTPLPLPSGRVAAGPMEMGSGLPTGGINVRVEISITSIAQELRLEG